MIMVYCGYVKALRKHGIMQSFSNNIFSTPFHLPNHLMFGSTLATVPGATVDWNCRGLMTFPRSLLEGEDQCQG